jgi:hypothetical protein
MYKTMKIHEDVHHKFRMMCVKNKLTNTDMLNQLMKK